MKIALGLLLGCSIAFSAPAPQALIAPYQGSKVIETTGNEFDSVTFPLDFNHRGGKTLALEGKITRTSYENPAQRSTLEVFRNYQQALEKAGFATVQYLKGAAGLSGGHTFVGTLGLNQLTYCYSPDAAKIHFLIAKKSNASATIHVAIFVAPCKPDKTTIWVVESRPMDTDQVKVNSDYLAEQLERAGHVAVYGIFFDFDRAELKKESMPALAEIAKLLRARPKLSLFVVGHTDTEGEWNHNLELSKRRAESVVEYLANEQKISRARLLAHGVGPLSPVATNRNEEGRAKNRRVELIER